MSDRENVVGGHVLTDDPDAVPPTPPTRVRQPNVTGSKKGAGNAHLLAAKRDKRKDRDRHRQAGERLVRQIIEDAGLTEDPVARMLSGALRDLEEMRSRLSETLTNRGFFASKTGDPRPAVKLLLDTVARQLAEARSLVGTLREMNEGRTRDRGEPVIEAYRCPACAHTWTVAGRAVQYIATYDDGDLVGSDPSGLVGVYDSDAAADAALAAQEPAGRDDAPAEGDFTSADLSRPGALPHRPAPGVGVRGTPADRKLDRLLTKYDQPSPAPPPTLADRWARGEDLEP